MAVLHFFTITIIFLKTLLVKTYSVDPYDSIHFAFSTTPELIRAASESKNAFSGYSYTTRDFNGGESNVIFATGAGSVSKLKTTMNSIYGNDAVIMSEQNSEKEMLDKIKDNSMSLEQQSEFKGVEAIMNKQEDIDLKTEVPNEEKKLSETSKVDDSFVGQASPYQVSFAPELQPTQFRTKLLSLQLPTVLSGYRVSPNTIQSQYYSHNPYTRVELPLRTFSFYNPTEPLFYQIPVTAYQIQAANGFEDSSTAVDNAEVHLKASIIVSSDTNATASGSDITEPNVITSKSNFETMASEIKKASSEKSTTKNTFKSTPVSEKLKQEITTEFVKSTEKSGGCCRQVVKMSSTEKINTEENSTIKKLDTETSTMAITKM